MKTQLSNLGASWSSILLSVVTIFVFGTASTTNAKQPSKLQVNMGGTSGGGGSGCRGDFESTHLVVSNWLKANEAKLDPNGVDAENFYLALNSDSLQILKDSDPLTYKGEDVTAFYDDNLKKIKLRCDRFAKDKKNRRHFRLVAHEVMRKMGIEGDEYEYSKQIPDTIKASEYDEPIAIESGVKIPGEMIGLTNDFKELAKDSNGAMSTDFFTYSKDNYVPPQILTVRFQFANTRSQIYDPHHSNDIPTPASFSMKLEAKYINGTYIRFNLSEIELNKKPLDTPIYKYTDIYTNRSAECENLWTTGPLEICLNLSGSSSSGTKIQKFIIRSRVDAKKINPEKPSTYFFLFERGGISYLGNQNKIKASITTPYGFDIISEEFKILARLAADTQTIKIEESGAGLAVTFTPQQSLFRMNTRFEPDNNPMQFTLKITKGTSNNAELGILDLSTQTMHKINSLEYELKPMYHTNCDYFWRADKVEICLKIINGKIENFTVSELGEGDDERADSSYWIGYFNRTDLPRYFGAIKVP